MANFKNLIPYFETSMCADQKSYNNHNDPKHLSRVIALESYKKWVKPCFYQGFPPFRDKFEGLHLLTYATHYNGLFSPVLTQFLISIQ